MRLAKQLAAIAGVILLFAAFDLAVYQLITKKYINRTSAQMQAKSIELNRYLPFEAQSEIVSIDSALTLSGDLPVLDGAAALYPVFSAFVHAVYPPESVQFDGEGFPAESALHYTNTGGAFRAVADGKADVIFCAQPSAEQLAYAAERGVTLELVPIGREAFVFLVNRNNPVDSLTVDQIKGIYAGDYTHWSQVGGAELRIDAVQRITGSGSQTVMLAFMGDTPMKRSPFGFMGSAIGFSFRYYAADVVANGGVKMLAVNGVYPSPEHIADGSYPIVSEFYAIYNQANDNPNIPVLIDWILSEEGQQIISETGYTPIR